MNELENTMGERTKAVSDFRYNVAGSRVPWAAVGEPVTLQEIRRIVRHLVQPAADRQREYEEQFKRVAAELERLHAVGQYAGKLTLGNQVASFGKISSNATPISCRIMNCTMPA